MAVNEHMMKKCFLDMDGVLVDFVKAICVAHGRPDPYLDSGNHGLWDMDKIWGIDSEEFWAPASTPGFWSGMEKTEEADFIVNSSTKLVGEGNVYILTSPSKNPNCVHEKREWVKKHYPSLSDKMIFTKHKELLAASDRILIDDNDGNVLKFVEAGGRAIQVPRKWNNLSHLYGEDDMIMIY